MRIFILSTLLIIACGEQTPSATTATPKATTVAPAAEAPAAEAPAAEAPAAEAPAAEAPAGCFSVFTEDSANESFQIIGSAAPEGCKFEGVSTKHSKMRVRWEAPPFQANESDKTIVEFIVVPSECAEHFDMESSGSVLSAKPVDNADTICPKQWAQLVTLTQADKLPNPIAIRAH
jgi:hypothetical protein